MASDGRTPLLKKSRWLLLKREENLKAEQRFRLRDLLQYNLKTVRAYLLKEAFQQLWDLQLARLGRQVPHEWCWQTMRSRIELRRKSPVRYVNIANSSSTEKILNLALRCAGNRGPPIILDDLYAPATPLRPTTERFLPRSQ